MQKIGTVKELWIYPVKSMAGFSVETADLYWDGIGGDRRYAFVQEGNLSTFPWLTGREVPDLLKYVPHFKEGEAPENFYQSPLLVKTPEGQSFKIGDPALLEDVNRRWKSPIRLIQQNRGVYDASPLSIMSLSTVDGIQSHYGGALDKRRFRQNIIIEADSGAPYAEDEWVDKTLQFGNGDTAVEVLIYQPIKRCQMVNVDPESADRDATVLKSVVRSRNNCVGMYAWPRKIGLIHVGSPIYLK